MNRSKSRPLAGCRIVITRSREQAGTLRAALERLGAEVIELPTISIRPPRSWASVDRAIRNLARYDWIIFTSANGVHYFFERLVAGGRDERALSRAKICAIGPATAAQLRARGLKVHLLPKEYRAEGLVAAFTKLKLKGKHILIPRARVARDLVPVELRRRGARVDVVEAYQTLAAASSRWRARKIFAARKPDLITFTSSSTVENFAAFFPGRALRRALDGVAVASIGPITSATTRRRGLEVTLESKPYTIAALVKNISRFFAGSQTG